MRAGWTRRRLLRGAAGVAVALPFLDLDAPVAAAPRPRRFVVFFSPNGTVASAWRPVPTRPSRGPERDFALGPILAPLEPHRERLLVLDGVDAESSYHGPGDASHWNGMGHMLTGTELVDLGKGTFTGGGISVDQRIAQAVGGDTRLASLELCVESSPATVAARMSYAGPGQPVPPEPSPHAAFARLFGEVPAVLRARRRSVLDAVGGDLAALEGRLGAGDRHRLDAHLTAVREVEKRLDVLPACAAPDPGPDPEDFPAIGRLHMDLVALALACDVTRVVSLMWSQAVSMTTMTWLGVSQPHHDLSHASPDDAAAQAALVEINRWYAGQLAYLLERMEAVPEGEGTLLDHSVVLWANEIADGPTHSRRGVPYVLAGRAGGRLATGRWLRYGGAEAGHVHNDLLVSLCRAMGLADATFGNPAYCHGELAGLTG